MAPRSRQASPPPGTPGTVAVTVEELAQQLRPIVRAGIDHGTPDTYRALFSLQCVQQRARDSSDDGLAQAARDIVRDAIAGLGDGPYGQAARLLFGTVADTRGQPLRDRRRMAAYRVDVLPTWFARSYERQLVRDVANGVYRTETLALPPAPDTGQPQRSVTETAPAVTGGYRLGRVRWPRRVGRVLGIREGQHRPVAVDRIVSSSSWQGWRGGHGALTAPYSSSSYRPWPCTPSA